MHGSVMQKIDKELKTALDALEKEKEAALKDLDSQVCTLHTRTMQCTCQLRE